MPTLRTVIANWLPEFTPPPLPPVAFPGSHLRPVRWAVKQLFDFAYLHGVSDGVHAGLFLGGWLGFIVGLVTVILGIVLFRLLRRTFR